ncbi:MAG: ArsR/SmtB family transcription factor [Vulcanimicrobiaceae bacterium]
MQSTGERPRLRVNYTLIRLRRKGFPRPSLCDARIYAVAAPDDEASGVYPKFYPVPALDRIKPQSQIGEIAENQRTSVEPALAGSAEKGFDCRWRRQIVELLAQGERSAGDLVREFTMTQPAVSQHLRALRNARLVQVRNEAQRRMYSLDPRGLAEMDAWLLR